MFEVVANIARLTVRQDFVAMVPPFPKGAHKILDFPYLLFGSGDHYSVRSLVFDGDGSCDGGSYELWDRAPDILAFTVLSVFWCFDVKLSEVLFKAAARRCAGSS